MMFTQAYNILTKAVEDTVGPTDTGVLYLMSRTAYALQSAVTSLTEKWLTQTGDNPNDPDVVTFMHDGKLLHIKITDTTNPYDIGYILDSSDAFSQLSQSAISKLQASIAVGNFGSGSDGLNRKQQISGQASTKYQQIQSTEQMETADPSSLSQQVSSSMNSFSGQPAADVAIAREGFGIFDAASGLLSQSM